MRSTLFNILYALWTAFMHLISLPILLLPGHALYPVAKLWTGGVLWLLKVCVGLNVRELGVRYLPKGQALFAVKHQSAWETLYLSWRLRHPAFILKRELLNLPLFGWYLQRLGMISIDRGGRANALKQMVHQAEDILAAGRPIVIFPEGTRVAPGAHRAYHPGIAALYAHLNVPVVPVALNSGLFWGRKALTKKPGCITVEYLPPIAPGLDRKAFMRELEQRIETATRRLHDNP